MQEGIHRCICPLGCQQFRGGRMTRKGQCMMIHDAAEEQCQRKRISTSQLPAVQTGLHEFHDHHESARGHGVQQLLHFRDRRTVSRLKHQTGDAGILPAKREGATNQQSQTLDSRVGCGPRACQLFVDVFVFATRDNAEPPRLA